MALPYQPAKFLLTGLVLLSLTACSGGGPASGRPSPPADGSTAPPHSSPPPTQPPPTAPPSRPDVSPKLNQANDLLTRGDAASAAEVLLGAVGEVPDAAPAWDLLSYAFRRMQAYDAAAGAGERAVTLAPESATAEFNAGLATAMAGDTARGAARLETAVRQNKQSAVPVYYLGAVYESAGQRVRAIEAYETGLKTFPGDADLMRARAALQMDLNGDGKPDKVVTQGTAVRVTDGDTGAELLAYEDQSGSHQPITTQVVDLGGSAPALIVQGRLGGAVFTWTNGKLTQLGALDRGVGFYSPVRREYTVGDVQAGLSTSADYQIEANKLVGRRAAASTKEEPPIQRLADLAAATAHLNPRAFADPAQAREVQGRYSMDLQGHNWAVFLLPEPNGYRIELQLDGKPMANGKAKVRTAGTWQIESVTW